MASQFLQQLGPAFTGAIGYATRNPFMQQQANETQRLLDTIQMQMPAQQAHAAINDAIAKNDPIRAAQIYQQGMKNGGFRGTLPNPYRERSVANLHRNLAKYMGTGAPRPLD